MIKEIGRIVSRGKIAGLFIPFGEGLPNGIYQIRDIMGELSIVRVGDAAMPEGRFTGVDLDGLFLERPNCCMTQEELAQVR